MRVFHGLLLASLAACVSATLRATKQAVLAADAAEDGGALAGAGEDGGAAAGGEMPDFGKRVLHHLDALVKDVQGGPNPRVACTAGAEHAANYIAGALKAAGAKPYGDSARSSYFQMVPGTVDARDCPNGMKNVIGLVEGVNADEIVIVIAHYEGPNFQNTELQRALGNQDTTNAFDNGAAVAIALAMAEHFAGAKPARSLLFILDIGEEGWNNVGVPPLGREAYIPACDNSLPPEARTPTAWFDKVFNAQGKGFYPHPAKTSTCNNYAIGATQFIFTPTVPLEKAVFVFSMDSLGAPPRGGDGVIVASGGNEFHGQDGKTLNDFIKEVWPAGQRVLPLARKQVESNYGSIDVFTKDYARLKTASGGGDARAGIPGLWFVQPWMQKYHGGMKFGELRRPGLANAIPGFLGGPNGNEFLDTAYYSVDKLAAVNLNDVASTAETLRTVLGAIVADERLKTFTYKGTTAWAGDDDEGEWKITTPYTQADVRNIADIFALVKARALPAHVAKSVYAFVDVLAGNAAKLAQMQSLDNAQGDAHQMGLLSVGLVTLLDFFNTNYDVRCVAHALHLFNLAFCGACLCNPRFLARPLSLRRPRSPLARKPSASSRRIRRELSRRSRTRLYVFPTYLFLYLLEE